MTDKPTLIGLAELTQHEIEVLRILNGEDVPGWCWGAAMSECCQALKARGLASGMYHITQAGKDCLRAIAGESA